MNQSVRQPLQPIRIGPSACPHDCPSTCALEVEVLDDRTIGRVRGAAGQRLHRGRDLRQGRALRRAHPPSRPADAADAPHRAEGLGLVRADLLGRRARSRRREIPATPSSATARRRSGRTTTPAPWASCSATASTACATPRNIPASIPPSASTPAYTGFAAGTGRIAGPDPREMAKSDLVVIWGTNPVNTQVNVMTHAIARPQGARRQDRRGRRLHERHDGAGRSRRCW